MMIKTKSSIYQRRYPFCEGCEIDFKKCSYSLACNFLIKKHLTQFVFICYNNKKQMRAWRNWQTRQTQDLVFSDVQVQVLSPAPGGAWRQIAHKALLFTKLVARGLSFRAIFIINSSERTSLRSLAPPFRKKSRSARLFGCKRPHDGSLSLPPFCDRAAPVGRSRIKICYQQSQQHAV